MTEGSGAVGGRYVLGESLGRGGMAEVHRATDRRLNRLVAVKRLAPELAADPIAQTRFRREAQAAASLNHPAIAAVFDTGEDIDPVTGASIPFIVMELVEGPTLRQVLADQGHLPPERALGLIRDVLDALTHSHAAGIVHRDIKPANVMLTPAGQVKVMDFGIARAVDDSTSGGLTQTAAVVGTAHYLSPEQARGERVDRRSDLYAAGCLLYALLVGNPPFVGDSSLSVAYQHVREPADAPSRHVPGIDPEIDALVAKSLAKDPGLRYQDAAEMQTDIDRVLAGQPVAAPLAAAVDEPTMAIPAPTAIRPSAAVVPAPAAAATPAATPLADPSAPVGPDEPRRRSPVGRILIAVLVVLLALGGFGIYRFLNPGRTTVSVPQVVGSSRADAQRELSSAGLTARFAENRGPAGSTVGTATKQRPTADTDVSRGSVVTVTINVGPTTGGTEPTSTAPTAEPSDEASNEATDEATDKTSDEPSDESTDKGSDDDSTEPTESASSDTSSPRSTGTRSPSASASESESDEPEPSATSKPAQTSEPPASDEPSSTASSGSASTSRSGATVDQAGGPSASDGADDLS